MSDGQDQMSLLDMRLMQMTQMAMDIFKAELKILNKKKTKRIAKNNDFEAMRAVMVPILMYIEELENKIKK